MRLDVENLCFSYGGKTVLGGLSFSAGPGEVIALLGPNGAGKSTLFRCMLGFLQPQEGKIAVDGEDVSTISRRALSQKLAYIPQSSSPAFDHTVLDCVLMGAAGRLGPMESPGKPEKQEAMGILEELGIADLARRGCMKISGGERQLMLLARALFQHAQMLIMDEPTANLDYGNSCLVMQRVTKLAENGRTVLFSTHDPNQAFCYASRVLALKDGTFLSDGAPEAVLTEETLSALYGVCVALGRLDCGGAARTVAVAVGEAPGC